MNLFPNIIDASHQMPINEDCKSALVSYSEGLVKAKSWALEMLDSTSKSRSGLLEVTLSDLGFFDQCLGIEVYPSNGSQEFTGQYCAVEVKRKVLSKSIDLETDQKYSLVHPHQSLRRKKIGYDDVDFLLGVCVPSECTHQDVQEISRKVSREFSMEINVPKCYVKEKVLVKPVHVATIFSVCSLLALGIYGASVELKLKKVPRSEMKRSRFEDVIMCFSLTSNYRRLVTGRKSSDGFQSLCGMRALTIVWVMLGHNYMWTTNLMLTGRPKQLTHTFRTLQLDFILNSWLYVESFFLISGVLTSYSVMKHLNANHGKINVSLFILRRYFRNLLLLSLIIGLAFFLPILSSGPSWYSEVDPELNNCVQRWWADLLFISNWYSMKKICISPVSWYVSADLQLHAVSLIFLYPLHRKPKLGFALIACTIVVCSIGIGAVTYLRDLPPTIQFTIRNQKKMQDVIDLVHLRPSTHAGPYLIGITIGYILFKRKYSSMKKIGKMLGWSASIALALASLYLPYNWKMDQKHRPVLTALVAGLNRTTFAVAVAWVTHSCVTGNAGLVEKILSCRLLSVGGRLTFTIFLLHSLVFWVRLGSVRERMFLSHYNLIYEYIGNVFLTVLLALPCHLLLEAPILQLEALLFPEKAEELRNTSVANTTTVQGESKTSSIKVCEKDVHPEYMQNIYINYPEKKNFNDKSYTTVVFIKTCDAK
ncbi:hypothetical protein JTE90_008545 [Oedothorax gibbosus]|uniref:Nose resistant-to-fluoxetine protein N-terminal domain-containing protein n=1 Tax=Oedothorax gibbosus TaxID=931172 RepID=A0AAV6VI96_9ARAC|nr:hypothetical protein JTE90_008545 [Oedothorax gibbosus]